MKKHFVTGLVLLLPIVITIGIVLFFINFLTKPFIGIFHTILSNFDFLSYFGPQFIYYTSKLLTLIFVLFFIIFLGAIGRVVFVHWFFNIGDKILHKIPFINKVYKTSQDIITTLLSNKKKSFKQVVMVPFPSKASYCIGFVTQDAVLSGEHLNLDHDLVSVFIPTTPNPTSGYLLLFNNSDVIYLDIPVEDAIKFIISCGVIHPF